MIVTVGPRTYQMSLKQYQGLLQVAKEQVPYGIYAIEKGGTAELRNDACKGPTQLKALIRQFRRNGYKVHANGR